MGFQYTLYLSSCSVMCGQLTYLSEDSEAEVIDDASSATKRKRE